MRTVNTLIRLGGFLGWSESSLGTQSLLVLSCQGSFFPVDAYLSQYCQFSWEILFMPYANNKGADQHPCLDSKILILAKSKISRLFLVSASEQASLSLTGSQTPKDRFSREVAHFYLTRVMRKMRTTNDKGADQPAHQCSLISTFVVHCLDSIIPKLAISKISRL